MLEPDISSRSPRMVDPSPVLRSLLARFFGRIANTTQISNRRAAYEKKRLAHKSGHRVEYFQQACLLAAPLGRVAGKGLHRTATMKRAVDEAGLDWHEASKRMGSQEWKEIVEQNQDEMFEGMGLWGAPSYRLTGLVAGAPDIEILNAVAR